jgi:hypothetical protein
LYSGSTEETETSAADSAFLKPAMVALSARGWTKNGMKSSRGDSSMCS